ncbi:MAG TPA: S-layer homology domain-containing protein [Candidatus Gastranaerophilales bacterium]|nr:S-layer homology domain-containing protein [Candidatus Gastranaerophilales bacterium]
MNFKKLTSLALSTLLLSFNASFALAANFTDIPNDYWATKEINVLTEKGIISGYPDSTFKPDQPVSRAEFIKMLIKTLDKDEISVNIKNNFTDISNSFWGYNDILRAKKLELVVGYPDLTFKPFNSITKSEATSIVSKTVKEHDCPVPCSSMKQLNPCPKDSSLKQFQDNEKIASWAKKSFTKAVKHELYVNYPARELLTPNKQMTRAETSVLLYKLLQKPQIVMTSYQGPALQQATVQKNTALIEHLPSTPFSGSVNQVEINGLNARIFAENVVPVRFEGGFESKKAKKGEFVNLVFTQNLTTEEGTTVIPAGSKFVSEIVSLKRGKPFHINAEMALNLQNLVTPSGKAYPLTATIQNNELLDPAFGKCNLKRLGMITGSVAVVGSLLGVTIGAFCDEVGDGAALGSIIGGGTGLALGLVAPGCGISISEDQDVYVKINSDLEIELK